MKKITAALALLAPALLTGCISLNEEKIAANTPVQLHPAAQHLKGAEPVALYVESQLTVPDLRCSRSILPIRFHLASCPWAIPPPSAAATL